MPDILIEVITGIDLENTPPCEMLIPYPSPCGQPSVARLRTKCGRCCGEVITFACRSCRDKITRGNGGCRTCLEETGQVPIIRILGES